VGSACSVRTHPIEISAASLVHAGMARAISFSSEKDSGMDRKRSCQPSASVSRSSGGAAASSQFSQR
jgi:hypothetical protein